MMMIGNNDKKKIRSMVVSPPRSGTKFVFWSWIAPALLALVVPFLDNNNHLSAVSAFVPSTTRSNVRTKTKTKTTTTPGMNFGKNIFLSTTTTIGNNGITTSSGSTIGAASQGASPTATDVNYNNNNNNGITTTIKDRITSLLFVDEDDDQWIMGAGQRPNISTGRRYRSKDWLINLMSLPKSFVLRRIKFHLLSNTILSLIVVLLNKLPGISLSIPILAHTMVGGFLGLLLVFRTDSAYSRFWEARHIWTKTKETCRNLAITASTSLKHHSPKSATKILELLIAFPEALAFTCLSGDIPLTNRLQRIIPDRMQRDPAMCLCLMMQQQLVAAATESPTCNNNIVEARYHGEASNFIQKLMDATTHCEMIVRTPVPWSYSRHTSRFLTIWCGTLPLALVPTFGWLTLPTVMVICWCLFGIEEIGHLIEQPFVGDDHFEVDNNNNNGAAAGGDLSTSSFIPNAAARGFLSPSDRIELKSKAYDIGIPVEQLAWIISGQVVEIAHAATQLSEIE